MTCPCFAGAPNSATQEKSENLTAINQRDSWISWEVAAGGIFAVGMATRFDTDVRTAIQTNDEYRNQPVAKIGNSWAEMQGGEFALGLLGLGWYLDNKQWMYTGKTMIWSCALGTSVARVGKYVGGRLRPYQSDGDSGNWFTSNGESFPSGHTTQAFALSTAFAESVPNPSWQRRLFAYSLAASTAYARMYDDKHWLSDTVAGALVGSISAMVAVKYDLANKGMQLFVSRSDNGDVGVTAVKTW